MALIGAFVLIEMINGLASCFATLVITSGIVAVSVGVLDACNSFLGTTFVGTKNCSGAIAVVLACYVRLSLNHYVSAVFAGNRSCAITVICCLNVSCRCRNSFTGTTFVCTHNCSSAIAVSIIMLKGVNRGIGRCPELSI